MRRSILLALLPLAVACSPSSSDTAAHSAPTDSAAADSDALAEPLEPLDTARAASNDARADTLLTSSRRHPFSAPAAPDVFSLVLRGPSVLTGEATFTITTAQGEVIFREVLTAPDLEAALVYEMKGPTATPAEREAYVRRRIREFFAEGNFHRPALPPTAPYPTPPPVSPDQATWNDLKQRPDAISFHYLVGKEDRRTLAWSPLQKQVVHLP